MDFNGRWAEDLTRGFAVARDLVNKGGLISEATLFAQTGYESHPEPTTVELEAPIEQMHFEQPPRAGEGRTIAKIGDPGMGRFGRLAANVRDHRVDTVGGKLLARRRREIGGREPKRAAASVACTHSAFDLVGVTEEPRGALDPTGSEMGTDGARRAPLAIHRHRWDGLEAKAEAAGELGEQGHITAPLATEAEVDTSGNRAHTQPSDQEIAHESFRFEAGESPVERQHAKQFDAERAQPLRFGAKGSKARRRSRGVEDFTRMRLEGDHPKWRGVRARKTPRRFEHGAMTEVDAVEIADRDRGPAGRRRQLREPSDHAHAPLFSRRDRPVKRAARGFTRPLWLPAADAAVP